MKQGLQILVVTDSATHKAGDTIFPLIRSLFAQDDVANILIADRNLVSNHGFFNANASKKSLTFVQPNPDYSHNNHRFLDMVNIDTKKIDAVLLRIDHPITPEFLEHLKKSFSGIPILNNPDGLQIAGAKDFLYNISDEMDDLLPPVRLCSNAKQVSDFTGIVGGVVLKQLRSYGGKGVMRYRPGAETDLNSLDDVEKYLAENGHCLAMQYQDNPAQSDNRLIVLDGKFIGGFQRVAADGGWLCNLNSAGSIGGVVETLTEREQQIIDRISPMMKQMGVLLYGVDVLMNANNERVLSEINTLNVGGIARLEGITGQPLVAQVATKIVEKIQEARSLALQPRMGIDPNPSMA